MVVAGHLFRVPDGRRGLDGPADDCGKDAVGRNRRERRVSVNRGYFLAIAGNIGVGKTELTSRLSAELGWLAYYEPVIDNPYLDVFYADMPRWSFHLQIYFLSERFKAQAEIGASQRSFIQDRTIYEDAEIFA